MHFEWDITDIYGAHPDLYLEHCAAMTVALLAPSAETSCRFKVHCKSILVPDLEPDCRFDLEVLWTKDLLTKARRVQRTEQRKPMVERAAVALAALLLSHFLPASQIRVTRQGECADYWLPQIQCALEVSGAENAAAVPRRHRVKREQVLANPLGWAGHVVICCFDERDRMIEWSFHAQPESKR